VAVHRHFPQRSTLIVAVVDACADTAQTIAAAREFGEALTLWLRRFADFIAIKGGLAALQSASRRQRLAGVPRSAAAIRDAGAVGGE
jgi:peptidyl-tRNA hydrolase